MKILKIYKKRKGKHKRFHVPFSSWSFFDEMNKTTNSNEIRKV